MGDSGGWFDLSDLKSQKKHFYNFRSICREFCGWGATEQNSCIPSEGSSNLGPLVWFNSLFQKLENPTEKLLGIVPLKLNCWILKLCRKAWHTPKIMRIFTIFTFGKHVLTNQLECLLRILLTMSSLSCNNLSLY